jgi:predicted cation transporter
MPVVVIVVFPTFSVIGVVIGSVLIVGMSPGTLKMGASSKLVLVTVEPIGMESALAAVGQRLQDSTQKQLTESFVFMENLLLSMNVPSAGKKCQLDQF